MFFSSTLQITSAEHERWHSTLCILKKNLAVTMTNERESTQCITQIGLSLTTDTFARKHPWRLLLANRELKQQWRWRLTKRHLKSEFALLQLYRAYSISFNSSNLEFNSKGLYQSSGKEKESWVLSRCSRATTAKKCTKKHDACAKLLLCQSKPIGFSLFLLPSLSLLLKLPNILAE